MAFVISRRLEAIQEILKSQRNFIPAVRGSKCCYNYVVDIVIYCIVIHSSSFE